MKKVLILLIIFSFVLSGCTGSNLNNSDQNSRKEIKNFEQPQNAPDLSGLIKSIIGNEVTILKMEMNNPDRINSKKNSEIESEVESKPKALTGTTNTKGIGMGMGGRQRPEGMDENTKLAMLDRMKEMSSGEEIVIIPVGIQMLKMDSETRSMVNADLTDVEVDSMISIWLNKDISDRNIAQFVLIK